MVKLKGPALSGAAAGALGGTLIFSEAKGRRYLKRWHKPKNPRTPSQKAMRAILRFLSEEWKNLSIPDKALWTPLAAKTNVPNFNAYQAFNIARWRSAKAPSQIPTTDSAGSFGNMGTMQCTAVSRGIKFDFTIIDDGERWANLIFHVPNYEDPWRWDRLVHLIQTRGSGYRSWIWRPLAPGTYNIAHNACKIHGQHWTGQFDDQVVVA